MEGETAKDSEQEWVRVWAAAMEANLESKSVVVKGPVLGVRMEGETANDLEQEWVQVWAPAMESNLESASVAAKAPVWDSKSGPASAAVWE